MPEVAGDAALLVDPHDEEDIADALMRLAVEDELRETLVAARPGSRSRSLAGIGRCARRGRFIGDLALVPASCAAFVSSLSFVPVTATAMAPEIRIGILITAQRTREKRADSSE